MKVRLELVIRKSVRNGDKTGFGRTGIGSWYEAT